MPNCSHENATIIVVESFAEHELIALKCPDCGRQSKATHEETTTINEQLT
jgi:uncharacterized OB-fold protein